MIHTYYYILPYTLFFVRGALTIEAAKRVVESRKPASFLVVFQPVKTAIHCINPDCPHPYPQTWGNNFCNSCGSPLRLKERYIPLQRLGAGGFATIYTVWDLTKQTERVLKVLVEVSPKALTLFEQEAAVLASLRQHPGVPQVDADGYFQLHLGQNPERQLPCLVMEKIDGSTLEEVLAQYPQGCPEARVLDWLHQAVEILQELHRRRIIHRDLKPSNLMLRSSTGQLVAIDFGGAKQIGPARSRAAASSTRLFSSGYSPPEQIAGGVVGPTADFYALGRTMIQLLTGKYPPELEDPLTGKLRWREQVAVSPSVADLLDDMVQEDARQRPASAAAIQARLARSQQHLVHSRPIHIDITTLTKGVSQTTLFLVRGTTYLLGACFDTVRGMVLSVIGGGVGAVVGFVLTYWSPAGAQVANFLHQKLPGFIPDNQITAGAEILLFAAAGLGTAWGLTAAGGFGQRRRYLVAALMGLLGYSCGWLVLLVTIPHVDWGGLGLVAVAAALLTLGLGLPSHHLVHAVVTASGTTAVITVLINLNLFNSALFHLYPQPSWLEFGLSIAFFGFMSVALSFWLGVSYYLVVPCLRRLGWR
ncbi:MAG: serine/threonine protein kinase [Chroococcidiopsidaceae cyanobacterium CP_BM_RX_35]|nr:serine/threonine protein kinase [Chroococcidiopsidaceae cyanobacterium CP_BM_RX_35]